MSARVFILQDEIVARLTATAGGQFTGWDILSLRKKDKESDIDHNIAKLATAIGVFIASYDLDPRRKGIHFTEVRIQIGVVEKRITNETGKTSEEIVEAICERLSGWVPACSISGVPITFDTPTVVEIAPENEADKQKRLIAINLILAGDIEESES